MAEAVAIRQAVKYIIRRQLRQAKIISDSQSALMSLALMHERRIPLPRKAHDVNPLPARLGPSVSSTLSARVYDNLCPKARTGFSCYVGECPRSEQKGLLHFVLSLAHGIETARVTG
ncbi:hypothetical protein AVEN_213931-1 [Araneus ventricosus]|uniref:RNase H type-1 domain-containing protein n=1 Tax=Araneus ventricosus TaxID=182803 RepID=A0A4Y2WBG1_ARAVE|nr:hypothetical protein AVEN_105600-1 [Araneus ventricosus]GBO33955.1 hypothetical protein AVEN_213931-1 [Araneus ventricosus]